MKKNKTLIIGAFIMLVFIASAFVNKIDKHLKSSDKGFAVIELFTSEGCSSCPSADAVIAKIEKESSDKPIYILAYHVDYWDRGGWKDSFSSADYTARQKKYASWLKSSQLYTPQAVVNGTTEMIGSEEGKLRNAIKTTLAVAAASPITLTNVKADGNKVNIHFETKGANDKSSLVLALIQKSGQTKVGGGENDGRTLSHVQIVRAIKNITIKSDGNAFIDIPKGFNIRNSEVIALVQNANTGIITGAAKAAVL